VGPNGKDNSITRQQTVQVGLTSDGPLIQKSVFTRETVDDQITSVGFSGMTITPTASGGPDISRYNTGRKLLKPSLASLRDTATRFQMVSHHLGDESPTGAAVAVDLVDCVQGWQL
jgi:hypothetical protein